MVKGDRISGIFLLVCSLVMANESYRLGVGKIDSPLAGFFPFVASIILGILSIILLFSTIYNKRQAFDKNEEITFNKHLIPKVLYVIGSLFFYAIFLNTLGFLLISAIVMAFMLWAIEPQKWYVVALGAVLIPSLSYLLFDVFLKVQLPIGFLGF